MKRLILAIAIAFTLSSCATSYYSTTLVDDAVVYPAPATSLVNISIQPSWGPAGYNYAMYYYFPEFNFYYDVDRALFYYLSSGRWVSAKVLPKGRHYPTDLHRYYKVVINERNPWNYNRQHKSKYKHYKGVYTQRNLRDERREKEAPRRIQPPQQSTPSRNNNTMHSPQSTPYRDPGNAGPGQMGSKPQGNSSKPNSNATKPGSNSSKPNGNSSKPGSSSSKPSGNPSQGSVKPGGNSSNGSARPGSSSRPTNGNVKPSGGGNGSSQGNTRPSGSGNVKPSGGNNVKPSGGSTPSRGTTKPSGGSSSKSSTKSSGSSKSSSSGSRSGGSQSSGSRSTGSRGR